MNSRKMYRGQRLVVTRGPLQGHNAICIDPTAVPDGQENQRKVLVDVDGQEIYILPRALEAPGQLGTATVTDARSNFTEVEAEVDDLAALVATATYTAISQIDDPMDEALDRFRPDPDVVKSYIPRMLPNGMTDIDFLLTLRREHRNRDGYSENVALVGETQAGKTMLVDVLAVKAAIEDGLPKPYAVLTLNGSVGISSYDLYGQPTAVTINGKETIVWMDGLVEMAVRSGSFLYLDEWNAVPPGQAVAIHPVLDDRRRFTNYQKAVPNGHGGWMPDTVKAHKSLWTISTINPGYKGVQTMAEASTNRFEWFSWDYDAAVEAALIPSTTVLAMGEALRTAREQRILSVPVGTSALQRFLKKLAMFGADTAIWSIVSMFPVTERARVTAIITDRGFRDLLHAEYPNPVHGVIEETEVSDDPSEPF